MTTTIPTLLIVATVAFAPQSAAQKTNQPKQPVASSRVPVDVSIQGLTVAPSTGSIADCMQRIADQATEGCLQASSMPTFGVLFPYPGINNTFVGPAFVAGGEDNQATGPWSTVGGGRSNTASGDYATVGGGGGLTRYYYGYINYGNTASGKAATVAGGRQNTASGSNATVGGGFGNTASGESATVAGGGRGSSGNSASADYATVGGGSRNGAGGKFATVGGGRHNTASGIRATVGGGSHNTASGDYATIGGGGGDRPSTGNTASADYATVGGGTDNHARGTYSTVGGGSRNTTSGNYATVGGGFRNTAYGRATVAGGVLNTAFGTFSFAAGRRAKANHDGAFVWGDSGGADKPSSAPDEFNVYCSGGARFFTNSAATTGVLLAPGGGSWSSVSDRDSKENVEAVDGRVILERLVSMPLATWNYKAQDDSIRHMGPMAQDFHAAFGLGVSEKLIDTIDPDGVALAAIQGLHALVEEQAAELDELRSQLAALTLRVDTR